MLVYVLEREGERKKVSGSEPPLLYSTELKCNTCFLSGVSPVSLPYTPDFLLKKRLNLWEKGEAQGTTPAFHLDS